MATRLAVSPGDRYGRLSVLHEVEGHQAPSGQRQRRFAVRCDCGNEFVVLLGSMRSGNTLSCGCIHREYASTADRSTHGMTGTPTYKSWLAMHERAAGIDAEKAERYRDRGIKVCERWETFENFVADMGHRPDGTTIDRIDNDGNYEPGNCRWADKWTQAANRRTSRIVILNGERVCLAEACRRIGIDLGTAPDRVKRTGCTLQEAVDHYAAKRAA